MGNSQIEEVTALLIAMETDRALVIDLFDRSVGDKVPELEREPWFAPYTDTYDRAIDLSKEQLAAFIQNNAQVNNVDFHPFIFARPLSGNHGIHADPPNLKHFALRGRDEQVALLPERREHLYAQFNDFVACGDWARDLKESVVVSLYLIHPTTQGAS